MRRWRSVLVRRKGGGEQQQLAHARDWASRWSVISRIGWWPPLAAGATPMLDRLRPGLFVLRDDTLATGTKSRWILEALQSSDKFDFLYVGAPHGHAQMVLAQGVRAWNSATPTTPFKRRAIIILEERYRTQQLPYRDVALKFGATVVYAADPFSAAQKILNNNSASVLLPPGLEVAAVSNGLRALASLIADKYGQFDEFWYAGGSGTIARAVQTTGLAKRYFAVQVQPGLSNVGKAEIVKHSQPFDEVANTAPPFPSASHYDAKAFAHASSRPGRILFWNVV